MAITMEKGHFLRILSVCVSIWSCIFSIIQIALMAWQTPVIKAKKDRSLNKPYPDFGVDPARSRFPGLYNRYVESAERKRWIALYALQLVMILAAVAQLITSLLLLYGSIKQTRNCIWPWFPCVLLGIFLCIGYSLIWLMGDPFHYWLTLSIFEFLCAIPINSVCIMIIGFYYSRIPKPSTNRQKDYQYAGAEKLVRPLTQNELQNRHALPQNELQTRQSNLPQHQLAPLPQKQQIQPQSHNNQQIPRQNIIRPPVVQPQTQFGPPPDPGPRMPAPQTVRPGVQMQRHPGPQRLSAHRTDWPSQRYNQRKMTPQQQQQPRLVHRAPQPRPQYYGQKLQA